LHGHHHNKNDR